MVLLVRTRGHSKLKAVAVPQNAVGFVAEQVQAIVPFFVVLVPLLQRRHLRLVQDVIKIDKVAESLQNVFQQMLVTQADEPINVVVQDVRKAVKEQLANSFLVLGGSRGAIEPRGAPIEDSMGVPQRTNLRRCNDGFPRVPFERVHPAAVHVWARRFRAGIFEHPSQHT